MLQIYRLVRIIYGFVFSGLVLYFQVFVYHEELIRSLILMRLLISYSQVHLNIWVT